MLEEFGRDLTAMAAMGTLDPLIGREDEIRKIIEALTLHGKNNPVLIGPPGVGKTCIVEGLAQRIASGNVPEVLLGKTIFQFDFTAVASGTMWRGMLEERLDKIMNELISRNQVILFIDEIHLISKQQIQTGFDLGNYLKPFIAKGEITLIGATTEEEFKLHIEDRDAALARRFIRVRITEPSTRELKSLLIRLGKRFGANYRVVIPEATVDHVIKLADQYIKDRFFPDKAIDLMKESIAEKRFSLDGTEQRLRRDLTSLDNVIASEISHIKSGDLLGLEKALQEWDKEKAHFFDAALTIEDVSGVVAKKFGVIVAENQIDEVARRIKLLTEGFEVRIIGQKRTKEAILGTLKMLGAGIRKRNKPIGSFLFLGPSGTGKTETAKTIAEHFFGDERRLIRFDMSEFYDRHTIARLVGSPPGYIGSEEDGLLFKLISKNPFSVILFDEIEKAHPQLFDIFLQMLDEGYVKDMKGNITNFKESLIIITSNVGTEYYAGLEQQEFDQKFDTIQAKVLEKLKQSVRPEIINRIDSVIPFAPFTRDELRLVFRKLARESSQAIAESKKISYELSDDAVNHAVETGFDSQFGARPMQREVRKLEHLIADAVLDRSLVAGDKVRVDVESQKFVLRKVFES